MHSFLDYELPPDRIAQQPTAERDLSKLMVLRRESGDISHRLFRDLPDLLNAGDLLVLNDTRVLPARLIGHRDKTGGKWEGLFLREVNGGRGFVGRVESSRPAASQDSQTAGLEDSTRPTNLLWEMLCQTKGKPELGESFSVEGASLRMILRGKEGGHWLMKPEPDGSPADLLQQFGHMPLPPYIRKGLDEPSDRDRYQTVFARADGSVAAPTAGLHFTPAVFDRLRERGIHWTHVTLHIGLGTFEPIRAENPTEHVMHHEWADVPPAAVEAIQQCKAYGGRVISVGTTATRALESAARDGGLKPRRGETNLFIQEPYAFRVIDGLITNFHLPRTTLLLLVGAFAGSDLLRRAYAEAIANAYRFYSYGDAMLIL
jgi:S-adenosylmethionine:tRNA ribosyltransferase-isomerase